MLETVKKTLFVINRLGFAGMLICLGIEVAPEHPAAAIIIGILGCAMGIYFLKYKSYTPAKTLPFGNPTMDIALIVLLMLDIINYESALLNTFCLAILIVDLIYWMVVHYSDFVESKDTKTLTER